MLLTLRILRSRARTATPVGCRVPHRKMPCTMQLCHHVTTLHGIGTDQHEGNGKWPERQTNSHHKCMSSQQVAAIGLSGEHLSQQGLSMPASLEVLQEKGLPRSPWRRSGRRPTAGLRGWPSKPGRLRADLAVVGVVCAVACGPLPLPTLKVLEGFAPSSTTSTYAPRSETYHAADGPPTPRRAVAFSASVQRGLRVLPNAPRPHAWTRSAPERPVPARNLSLSPGNLCFAWSTPQRVQGSASR